MTWLNGEWWTRVWWTSQKGWVRWEHSPRLLPRILAWRHYGSYQTGEGDRKICVRAYCVCEFYRGLLDYSDVFAYIHTHSKTKSMSSAHIFCLICMRTHRANCKLRNSPNCSFFMAATYFSSRERRMDRGLGRLDTFLEVSTNFLSGKEVGFGMGSKNHENQSEKRAG